MPMAILTFLVVLAIVFGGYWLFVLQPETSAQTSVRRRLRAAAKHPKAQPVVTLERGSEISAIPTLGLLLQGAETITARVQTLIDRAGMRLTVGKFVLLSACCGLIVYLAVAFTTGTVLVALAAGSVATSFPYFWIRYKANKRMDRFEELFPEAIGLIVRALRAGHAFTTGLAMVAEEIGDPVGPEFRLVYDHQNFGMPVEDALKRLAQRIPLLDVRFFATAVLTQREAGGNLAEILENIASVIRDRFKVKRQVRVVTAHARITGLVLALMPVGCAFAVSIIAPAQIKVLFTDPLGIRMVVVAIALQILGALIIRKVVNIEY